MVTAHAGMGHQQIRLDREIRSDHEFSLEDRASRLLEVLSPAHDLDKSAR